MGRTEEELCAVCKAPDPALRGGGMIGMISTLDAQRLAAFLNTTSGWPCSNCGNELPVQPTVIVHDPRNRRALIVPGTLIANHVASDIFEKLGPREDLTIDSLNVMKDRSEVGLELVAWFRNDTRLLIAATQAVVDDGFNNWLKEHHQEISAQTFALGWLA